MNTKSAWVIWVVLLGVSGSLTSSSAASPPQLFLDAPEAASRLSRMSDRPGERSRVLRLNSPLLNPGAGSLQQPGARVAAHLFDGEQAVVVVERTEIKGPAEFICYGRVEGHPDSYVILAASGEALAGTITMLGQPSFRVQYLADGLHRLEQTAPGSPPPPPRPERPAARALPAAEPLPESPAGPMNRITALSTQPGAESPEAAPVMIDFMLLYTPRALAGAGGAAGINALLEFAVAQANLVYANSRVNVRWNIAHKGLISYTETGDIFTDLNWLLANTGSLRNTYKADLALLVVDFDTLGYAGVAGSWGSVFVRPYVISGSDFLVVHEVGHLLGGGHDRLTCANQPNNCGAKFGYSYGHRFQVNGTTYADIMSYPPGISIPYLSNPDVLFRGVPTGVPEGQTNSADLARSFNEYAPTVARFMQAASRFEFAAGRYSVAENAGTLAIEVVRSGDIDVASDVELITSNGTALAGADFSAITSRINFAPGEVRRVVTLEILDDALSEDVETFRAILRAPVRGSALGPVTSATVEIDDDETSFRFASSDMTVTERVGSVEITVLRRGQAARNASVRYAVAAGTAGLGTDFNLADGELAFSAGQSSSTIRLAILDDSLVETEETLTLILTDPNLHDGTAPAPLAITIADNERPGSAAEPLAFSAGPLGSAGAVAVASDGGILGGGRFPEIGGGAPAYLLKFAPDGKLDPSFLPSTLSIALEPEPGSFPSIGIITPLPDGKLLVGGTFATLNGAPRGKVARLHADGSVDAAFAPNPGLDGYISEIAPLPDGKILVCGGFLSVNGISRGIVARLHEDGSLDESFAAKPDPLRNGYGAFALKVQPDGKIVVGGTMPFDGGSDFLNRLNSDGTRDRTFRATPDGWVGAIHILADGKILIGGGFNAPRSKIARLQANGLLDADFQTSPAPNGNVTRIAALPDGRIMIAGEFRMVGGKSRTYVARLHPDGSLDESFDAGLGPNDIVSALAVHPDGSVIIGGLFTTVGGQPRPYLARLNSDGTRPTFAPPSLLAAGGTVLKLLGNAQATYIVESSTDLTRWAPVRTNRFITTALEWIEPASPSGAARFFRAKQSP